MSVHDEPASNMIMTPYVVRDEEVVGSNPAAPTMKVQVNGLFAATREQAVDRLTVV
jgi:hypothetical protein